MSSETSQTHRNIRRAAKDLRRRIQTSGLASPHLHLAIGALLTLARRRNLQSYEEIKDAAATPEKAPLLRPEFLRVALCDVLEKCAVQSFLETCNWQILFEDPVNLCWLHQFYNDPERSAASRAVPRKDDNEAAFDAVLTTQIHTPVAIGQRLSESLAERLLERREDNRIIDPACGGGALLVSMTRALGHKGARLFGCDVDAALVELTRFSLWFDQPSRAGVDHYDGTIVCLEDPGALNLHHPLLSDGTFDAVIMNPPYLGRKKIPRSTREYIDANYPGLTRDLSIAMISRAVRLLKDDGVLGLVTTNKWLFLDSYSTVRGGEYGLLRQLELESMITLTAKEFGAEAELHDGVELAVLVARKKRAAPRSTFVHSRGLNDAAPTVALQDELLRPGGTARLHLHAPGVQQSVARYRTVADEAEVIVGLQTDDDRRFVKYWWEAGSIEETIPYWKGGGYGRWGGAPLFVLYLESGLVGFQESGRNNLPKLLSFFARQGFVYSWMADGNLGLRLKEAGEGFGRAASGAVFTSAPALIAALNSPVASWFARQLSGKVQLPEGVVRKLPVPQELASIPRDEINRVIRLRGRLAKTQPNHPDYEYLPVEERLELENQAIAAENLLNRRVVEAYGLDDETQRRIKREIGTKPQPCVGDLERFARQADLSPSAAYGKCAEIIEQLQREATFDRISREIVDQVNIHGWLPCHSFGDEISCNSIAQNLLLRRGSGASSSTVDCWITKGLYQRVLRIFKQRPAIRQIQLGGPRSAFVSLRAVTADLVEELATHADPSVRPSIHSLLPHAQQTTTAVLRSTLPDDTRPSRTERST